MAKEIVIKCDCCKELIPDNKHYEPRDIVNTGSHTTIFEQLFDIAVKDNKEQIFNLKELCRNCTDMIEETMRNAIITVVKNIRDKGENNDTESN